MLCLPSETDEILTITEDRYQHFPYLTGQVCILKFGFNSLNNNQALPIQPNTNLQNIQKITPLFNKFSSKDFKF